MSKLKKRPGRGIIERYMPDATPEAQEEAYENLRGLIAVLVEIDDRRTREHAAKLKMLHPPLS